jgi:hypothetical protein
VAIAGSEVADRAAIRGGMATRDVDRAAVVQTQMHHPMRQGYRCAPDFDERSGNAVAGPIDGPDDIADAEVLHCDVT